MQDSARYGPLCGSGIPLLYVYIRGPKKQREAKRKARKEARRMGRVIKTREAKLY